MLGASKCMLGRKENVFSKFRFSDDNVLESTWFLMKVLFPNAWFSRSMETSLVKTHYESKKECWAQFCILQNCVFAFVQPVCVLLDNFSMFLVLYCDSAQRMLLSNNPIPISILLRVENLPHKLSRHHTKFVASTKRTWPRFLSRKHHPCEGDK